MDTKCKLQVRCGSISLDAAWGQAYPSGAGCLLYGVNLAPGFTKVNVDGVHTNFEVVPLQMAPNDEIVTLGQAIGPFIYWPKSDICLELLAPVSTSREYPTTVPSPRKLPAPELPPPELPASDVSTPCAQLNLVKSTSKKRGSKGKSKKPDDISFLSLAQKFVLGKPLVETVEHLKTLGMACTRLHE